MTEKKTNELSYEDAVVRIEALLGKLEQSDVPLEEAIKQFEHGTKLIKHCEKILAQTEQKIVGLTDNANAEQGQNTPAESPQSSLGLDDDIPF